MSEENDELQLAVHESSDPDFWIGLDVQMGTYLETNHGDAGLGFGFLVVSKDQEEAAGPEDLKTEQVHFAMLDGPWKGQLLHDLINLVECPEFKQDLQEAVRRHAESHRDNTH